ncbi:LPXTG cell wall anchor domain-containing protein [Streptomyces sp. NPDC091268]
MPMIAAPIAYKGLDSMPTWFVFVIAVLAVIGIVLACRRRR